MLGVPRHAVRPLSFFCSQMPKTTACSDLWVAAHGEGALQLRGLRAAEACRSAVGRTASQGCAIPVLWHTR